MRFASHVVVTDDPANASTTKRFDQETYRRLMRSQFFLGAVSFWRQLEKLAEPESYTCFHALGVLTEMAKRALEDCGGHPYSPPQEDCFRYLGFETLGVRSPGSRANPTEEADGKP
jgi:hypothetical protein